MAVTWFVLSSWKICASVLFSVMARWVNCEELSSLCIRNGKYSQVELGFQTVLRGLIRHRFHDWLGIVSALVWFKFLCVILDSSHSTGRACTHHSAHIAAIHLCPVQRHIKPSVPSSVPNAAVIWEGVSVRSCELHI